MSGPIVATFSLTPAVVTGASAVLLAAAAIREARAMQQEAEAAQDAARLRALELQRQQQQQREAEAAHEAALQAACAQAPARIERLREWLDSLAPLLQRSGQTVTFVPPAGPQDADGRGAWLAALDEEIARIESAVAAASARLADRAAPPPAPLGLAPSLDDLLAFHAWQRGQRPGLSPDDSAACRAIAARILARLERAPGETVPLALEQLARSIQLAPDLPRAEALASELRLQVQQANAARAAALQAQQQRLEQEAAALVLEQSLRDLGYDIEPIEQTLFVDGGMTHFRKPGWGDYFVRLRVDSQARSINFNVVRARASGEDAAPRREDVLAEDRWCSEFPRLMATLAARGLDLAVTRRLAAGELPVQQVDADTLPHIRKTDSASPAAQPLARERS